MARRSLIPTKSQPAPVEEDLRHDDLEYDPQAVEAIEPKSSKAWLNLLQESEDAFDDWNDALRQHRQAVRQSGAARRHAPRQRIPDVLGQSRGDQAIIYAKPPQPVVAPKFKDRRPVYQAAAKC